MKQTSGADKVHLIGTDNLMLHSNLFQKNNFIEFIPLLLIYANLNEE